MAIEETHISPERLYIEVRVEPSREATGEPEVYDLDYSHMAFPMPLVGEALRIATDRSEEPHEYTANPRQTELFIVTRRVFTLYDDWEEMFPGARPGVRRNVQECGVQLYVRRLTAEEAMAIDV